MYSTSFVASRSGDLGLERLGFAGAPRRYHHASRFASHVRCSHLSSVRSRDETNRFLLRHKQPLGQLVGYLTKSQTRKIARSLGGGVTVLERSHPIFEPLAFAGDLARVVKRIGE